MKLLLIILTLTLVTLTISIYPAHAQSPTPQVYWGAFIRGSAGNPTYPVGYGDAPFDLGTWDRFEANSRKKVSILHFAQPWKKSGDGIIRTYTIKEYTGETSGWNQALFTVTAPSNAWSVTVRMVTSSVKSAIYVDDLLFRKN